MYDSFSFYATKVAKLFPKAGLLSETAKKSSWPINGLWIRGPLKILNGTQLILDDQGKHLDSSVWNHLGPSEVP